MALNREELTMILNIIDISLEYGVPTIANAIENLNKEVISQDDIDNLVIDEEWESYFDEENYNDEE